MAASPTPAAALVTSAAGALASPMPGGSARATGDDVAGVPNLNSYVRAKLRTDVPSFAACVRAIGELLAVIQT
jgi:hypothetical protein